MRICGLAAGSAGGGKSGAGVDGVCVVGRTVVAGAAACVAGSLAHQAGMSGSQVAQPTRNPTTQVDTDRENFSPVLVPIDSMILLYVGV